MKQIPYFAVFLWSCGAALALFFAACGGGCIYAPRAQYVSAQTHLQTATNIFITQTIPVEPRVANDLDMTGVAGVKGDVGSRNTIASPSAKLK